MCRYVDAVDVLDTFCKKENIYHDVDVDVDVLLEDFFLEGTHSDFRFRTSSFFSI